MNRFRFLGFATIAAWCLTLGISLSMMWHRTWMEGDPPSEIAVGVVHAATALCGVVLGGSLFSARVRRALSRTQCASFVIACGLSVVSISSFLGN